MGNIFIGEQIKKLRTSKKMTLAIFAKRIGVTDSSVSAYENGTRFPSYDVLIRISKTFNISTDILLGCGSEDVVDVSGLNYKQRTNIEELIKQYKAFNEIAENISKDYNDTLLSQILIKYNLYN